MAEAWSGIDFLCTVDGPLERFPALRVLFLAHRVAATGMITIQTAAGTRRVAVAAGAVAGGDGFPNLLLEHSVRGQADEPMVALIGRAVAAGVPPERALADAGARLGERLAELVGARGGRIVFREEILDPRARVVLPDSIPRLLAAGLRRTRPAARLRATFGARLPEAVSLSVPDDSPESRWGLDPTALRVLRSVSRVSTLGELLGAGPPGQADQTAYAVDLLMQLGLILVEPRVTRPRAEERSPDAEARAIRTAQPTRPPPSPTVTAAPLAPTPGVMTAPAPATTASATTTSGAIGAGIVGRPSESSLRALKEAHARVKDALPADVLGIERSDVLTDLVIDKAHRELAARYHPDRNRNLGPEIAALASELFTRVNEAWTALKDPAIRKDEAARLKAREEGRPFVSEQQRARARICFARAEPLARNRRWAEALPELETAISLDPGPWRYHFFKAQAAFHVGRMTAEEADRYLRGLSVPAGEPCADVLYEAGEMLLRAGKEDQAQARFKEALAAFPDHHATKRRLRLAERRAESDPEKKTDSVSSSVSSVLSGLFKGRGRA